MRCDMLAFSAVCENEVRTTTTSTSEAGRQTMAVPSTAGQKYFQLSPPPADTINDCLRSLTTAAAPLERAAPAARRSRRLCLEVMSFPRAVVASVLGHAYDADLVLYGAIQRGPGRVHSRSACRHALGVEIGCHHIKRVRPLKRTRTP